MLCLHVQEFVTMQQVDHDVVVGSVGCLGSLEAGFAAPA